MSLFFFIIFFKMVSYVIIIISPMSSNPTNNVSVDMINADLKELQRLFQEKKQHSISQQRVTEPIQSTPTKQKTTKLIEKTMQKVQLNDLFELLRTKTNEFVATINSSSPDNVEKNKQKLDELKLIMQQINNVMEQKQPSVFQIPLQLVKQFYLSGMNVIEKYVLNPTVENKQAVVKQLNYPSFVKQNEQIYHYLFVNNGTKTNDVDDLLARIKLDAYGDDFVNNYTKIEKNNENKDVEINVVNKKMDVVSGGKKNNGTRRMTRNEMNKTTGKRHAKQNNNKKTHRTKRQRH